ncbi:MAG TPA: DNA/RNA helicase domain-containing protein, partial [Acidimicrobiales bacterium]
MHPDVPREQEYFDRALAHRERQREDLGQAAELAADPRAAAELRRRLRGDLRLADPDEGVAFGRIDTGGDRWYIGKHAIWDDDSEVVVVNWQAPVAAPFYTATPADPQGLEARRLFRCRSNRILDIEELIFAELERAVAEDRPPVVSDALLEALGSTRSGELREIVATIQAAQYDLITRDPDRVLIIQGGPGTGKTVVGLHRVSWLLHNLSDRLDANDVLVVGPNPTFMRYVSMVLPSLGDRMAVQMPITALGPRVRVGRVDPPELRRLKGDRRMLRVIVAALRGRQRVDREPVDLALGSRTVRLDGDRIAARARQLA